MEIGERERLICVFVNGSFNEQTRTPQVSYINSRTRTYMQETFAVNMILPYSSGIIFPNFYKL